MTTKECWEMGQHKLHWGKIFLTPDSSFFSLMFTFSFPVQIFFYSFLLFSFSGENFIIQILGEDLQTQLRLFALSIICCFDVAASEFSHFSPLQDLWTFQQVVAALFAIFMKHKTPLAAATHLKRVELRVFNGFKHISALLNLVSVEWMIVLIISWTISVRCSVWTWNYHNYSRYVCEMKNHKKSVSEPLSDTKCV